MNIPDNKTRAATLALLTINLLLLVALLMAHLASSGGNSYPSFAAQNTDSVMPETDLPKPTYSAPSIGFYEEIVSRPLFSETRLPPEKAANQSNDAVQENKLPPAFSLVGIVMTVEISKALLQLKNNKETVHVELGEKFDGWRVDAIQPDRIKVSNGSKSNEVILERAPPKTTPTRRKKRYLPSNMAPKPG